MASAIDGLVVVRLRGNQAGAGAIETTCFMRTTGGDPNTPAGMLDLAEGIASLTDGGGDEMQAFMSSSFNFVEVDVEDLSSTAWTTQVAPEPWSGDVAGDAAPTVAALVVTKQTAQAGRKYRGRYYFGGFPGSAVATAGLGWDVGTTDAMQAFAEAVHAAADALGYTPCLYHRASDTTTDIVSYLARSPIRTQRRREFGVGS